MIAKGVNAVTVLTSIFSVAQSLSERPAFVFRPKTLERATSCFQRHFNGTVLYAVKTNPDPAVLLSLYAQGVSAFDVASLDEVRLLRRLLPDAALYFMHPVKSRRAIRESYTQYGVRHFSLDSEEELEKILEETGHAPDLCLHLRLSIPNTYAELNLAEKFGANLQEAPALLRRIAAHSVKLGICFHTGSQSMHPDAYRVAMQMSAEVIKDAGVPVHYFNVGGGFPSMYPGMAPPDMRLYFDAIHEAFRKVEGHRFMQLLAEPGRALVAECMSLIARVELRKGNMLYLNDGTYGSLFDAGTPKFIFPVRLLRHDAQDASSLVPFSFYGPTCDSLDFMKGPFYLPGDVREGDMIEIGQMGAYARTMTTGFNGFHVDERMEWVNDPPLMTMYPDEDDLIRAA